MTGEQALARSAQPLCSVSRSLPVPAVLLRSRRLIDLGALRRAGLCAALQPTRAAREALAMVVLAGHLAAVAVEDDERRSSASTPAARLAERVRREVGRVDGRGGHRRSPSGTVAP